MCVRALLCLRAGGSFQGTGCSQDERGGGTTDARRPPQRPGSSANHHQPCSGLRIRLDLGVPQVLCPGNPAVTGCHTGCFVWAWRLPGEVGSGQRAAGLGPCAAGMHSAGGGGQRFAVLQTLLEMIPHSMHFAPFGLSEKSKSQTESIYLFISPVPFSYLTVR